MSCPLCQSEASSLFDQDKKRQYLLCGVCSLVYVPRQLILSADAEAARYDSHQNDSEDPHYHEYLKQIVVASKDKIPKKGRGLDFGCGKTKLLAEIYRQFDFEVDSYDLYFHPDSSVFDQKYDFIILSEVIEHLRDPKSTMEQLSGMLSPRGKFFIKTKLYPEDPEKFSGWFYKRDMTHVQFFNQASLAYLAQTLKLQGPKDLECQDLVELWS